MKKKYTKRQIEESIKYWERQLMLENAMYDVNANDIVTMTYSQLKRLIRESILDEGVIGKNEPDVAKAVFNAFNRSFADIPGMLVHGDGSIEYNGNFYTKASRREKLVDTEHGSLYKKTGAVKRQPDIDSDLAVKPSLDTNYGKGNTAGQAKLIDIKCDCLGTFYDHYSWAVFELGSLQYPGDVAMIMSEAANSRVSSATSGKGMTSVIEVKADSLGSRVFNPTFHVKEDDRGYFIEPAGRYGSIWGDLIDSINSELSQKKYQDIIASAQASKKSSGVLLNKFPLDVDFEDFVGRYATKNPFGPIEYLAMGQGDDITFYKLFQNPRIRLYGTGQANRLSKRNAEMLGNVFNSAYLSLRFKRDRYSDKLVGQVDFSHNGALMVGDADLAVDLVR